MHPIHTKFSNFVIGALYYSTLYIERIAHLLIQTGHYCDSIGHIRYAYLLKNFAINMLIMNETFKSIKF